MRRVGLLAGLLMLTLGTGTVAQSPSPSPSPTPLYAPEDLALVIPTRLASFEMEVDTGSLDDGDLGWDAETWRDILLPLGREPQEGRWAIGSGATDPDDTSSHGAATIEAIRVDGLLAGLLLDGYAEASAAQQAAAGQPPTPAEWLDVDGRHLRVIPSPGGWFPPLYLYPKGEVLFVIGSRD